MKFDECVTTFHRCLAHIFSCTSDLSHDTTKLQPGEVIDASTMSVEDLCEFYEREINDAKESDILLSLVRIGSLLVFSKFAQSQMTDFLSSST